MLPRFEYGDDVRVVRNVRNDGTFPGKEVGELLIRRGSVGHVHDVGTYLQDQLIYRVYFIESGRMVGCREEELVLAAEPWVDSQFEFRDRVSVKIPLSLRGEVVVPSADSYRAEQKIAQRVRPAETAAGWGLSATSAARVQGRGPGLRGAPK